jgi:ketosteroid isomerase-like protein
MNRWFAVVFLVMLAACSTKKVPPKTTVDEKIALIKTDKSFSDMSVEEGMKAAFIEYIDSNGVLLKPNHLPIVGANAIDFLIAQEDTGFTLNWQPQNAFVSASGDLGYTYGVYALHPKNMDTVLYGTYVSIWKKQADGSWKFVLDTGNQGIDSTEMAF